MCNGLQDYNVKRRESVMCNPKKEDGSQRMRGPNRCKDGLKKHDIGANRCEFFLLQFLSSNGPSTPPNQPSLQLLFPLPQVVCAMTRNRSTLNDVAMQGNCSYRRPCFTSFILKVVILKTIGKSGEIEHGSPVRGTARPFAKPW